MNKIINGDALEIVGDLGEFDFIITDPPYPTGGESSMRNPKSILEAREMIDGLAQSFIGGVVKRVKLKEDCGIFIFTDWRQVSFLSAIIRGMGFVRQSCVVWDKMRGNLSSLFHPSHEMILVGIKGKIAKGYLGKDVIRIPRVSGKNKTHAFGKPPELVEYLLKSFSRGGKVIDPFCGTGGLLVGCVRLGYEVVGIDISSEFCDIARRRLNTDLINKSE